MLDFAAAVDVQVVFGLQFFSNSDGYLPTNTADLLNWTASNGYHVRPALIGYSMSGVSHARNFACTQLYGVELGEEMAPVRDPGFRTLMDGYRQVHGMLQTLWPDNPVRLASSHLALPP